MCKKNREQILLILGQEAKEEEERKRQQERLRKEQELEKQRIEKEKFEEQQRQLAEKKLALEKAAAKAKEKEMVEKQGNELPSKPLSPIRVTRDPRQPLPKIPFDYFHKDWIEIILANSSSDAQWVSIEAWLEFLHYHDHYATTFKLFNSLKTSTDKVVLSQLQKFTGKIQGNFNALTTKQRQVDWKIETFTDELNGRMNSQLEYIVCIHYIADRLVFQGVSFIQKNNAAAYSFSYVAVGVSRKHPVIMNFIIAQLYESCPYCVPMIPPKQQGQTKEEYQSKVLKYKKTLDENGGEVLEPMSTFIKRVCGFITLMATLYCIQVGDEFPRIHKAWDWLTRFLQLKIRPYSATILQAFLLASNYYLTIYYKNQYIKLKQFIVDEWFPKLDQNDETPVNQMGIGLLKTCLEEMYKDYLNGTCELPESAQLSQDNTD
jgi:hypothetical protein